MGPLATLAAACRRAWMLPALIAFVCVAVWLGTQGDLLLDRVTLTATIYLVVVVGFYSFVGTSGVFSFGHMVFMMVGAYVAALLAMPASGKEFLLASAPHWLQQAHLDPTLAVLAGGLVAAAFAALVAIPVTRLSGIAAGLAMFAVLNIVFVVASNLEDITNGTQGLSGVPVSTTQTSALIWAICSIVLVFAFQRSRWGLRLRSSREDEVAARASGVSIEVLRGVALVLSAFVIGVGGGLMALFLGSFAPQSFYLDTTFLTIVMLIVGGKNSLTGAVVGVVVVSVLNELLRRFEQGWDLGIASIPARPGVQNLMLAAIILAVLAVRPSGLTGGRELDRIFRAPGFLRPKRKRSTQQEEEYVS